jgi:hypothetical protein
VNAKRSCSRTSDASNPTAGPTTLNAATSPNHTYHAVWTGTYTRPTFSQAMFNAFLLHILRYVSSRYSFQNKRRIRQRSPHTTRLSRQPPESVACTRFCPAPSFAFDERITDHSCAYRNLMAPDSFRNLGFGDDSDGPGSKKPTTTSSQTSQK